MFMEFSVDVDPEQVLRQLNDTQLAAYGLKRCAPNATRRDQFQQMRLAIYRHDLGALLSLVEKQADDAGVLLDTSALLKVAA